MESEVAVAAIWILLVLGVWLLAMVLIASGVSQDIDDQNRRNPVVGDLDAVDLGQQAELDRLHRVEKHFDTRLDRIEGSKLVLWALLILNTLANLAQILEAIRK